MHFTTVNLASFLDYYLIFILLGSINKNYKLKQVVIWKHTKQK